MINSTLIIGVWNARGWVKSNNELRLFLDAKLIDDMLVTETHMRPGLKICTPGYDQYYTNHPSDTAKGGSAVLTSLEVKMTLKYYFSLWETGSSEEEEETLMQSTNGGVICEVVVLESGCKRLL